MNRERLIVRSPNVACIERSEHPPGEHLVSNTSWTRINISGA
jgi:hypothetical protein